MHTRPPAHTVHTHTHWGWNFLFLLLITQQPMIGQTEATFQFIASNRIRNTLRSRSGCSCKGHHSWKRKCGRNCSSSEIGDVSCCEATTSGAMGKWMLRLDSACLTGLEIPFHGILMVVTGCSTGGKEPAGRILNFGNWGCICLRSKNH